MFGDIDDRAAIFAADREALYEPEPDEDARSPEADLVVCWEQPDRKGRRTMMIIVTRNVYLRPTKSPSRPKTSAPSGRTMNPAEKARSAKIKPIEGSAFEKNCAAMTLASEPKSTKSYHSKIVPREEARITLRSSAVSRSSLVAAVKATSLIGYPLGAQLAPINSAYRKTFRYAEKCRTGLCALAVDAWLGPWNGNDGRYIDQSGEGCRPHARPF